MWSRAPLAQDRNHLGAEAEALGKEVAADPAALRILLPEVVSGPGNLWPFGAGLAKGAENPRAIWEDLAKQFGRSATDKKDTRAFAGMLRQIREVDSKLANELLDEALNSEPLAAYYPIIQSSVGIDDAGVERLMRSLEVDSNLPTTRITAWYKSGHSENCGGIWRHVCT